MKLLNGIEDIAWLETTHLKSHINVLGRFNSFMIYGNEDCPIRVELYKRKDLKVNSKPFLTFIADEDNNLVKIC